MCTSKLILVQWELLVCFPMIVTDKKLLSVSFDVQIQRISTNSKGRGFQKSKYLKESIKLNWNLKRGGMGGGGQTKNPSV